MPQKPDLRLVPTEGTGASNPAPIGSYISGFGGTGIYVYPGTAYAGGVTWATSGLLTSPLSTSYKDEPMSDTPSREETREIINDKLAAVEARLDAKLTGIDAKIDRIGDAVSRFSKEIHEVKTDNKSTRTTIVVTVVVALLAALGVIITIQIGLLTAFSSGATEHVTPPAPPAVTAP